MKNVLVVGATGHLGPYIVNALVDNGHKVSALVRPETMSDKQKIKNLTMRGVATKQGSLQDHLSLEEACRGKDVVISCVGGNQISNQLQLAQAANKAGVARFIPSEFGLDPWVAERGSCDLFDLKAEVQKEIRQTGIGFTPIYTNGFMEFWAAGLGELGAFSPSEEVKVYGTGDTPAHMTALSDVGKYTAAIIEDDQTINREVLVSTTQATQKELISLWEDMSGKNVKKEFVQGDTLDEIISDATDPENLLTRIFTQLARSVWIKGESNKEREGSLNAVTRYPGIQPIGLKAFLNRYK